MRALLYIYIYALFLFNSCYLFINLLFWTLAFIEMKMKNKRILIQLNRQCDGRQEEYGLNLYPQQHCCTVKSIAIKNSSPFKHNSGNSLIISAGLQLKLHIARCID